MEAPASAVVLGLLLSLLFCCLHVVAAIIKAIVHPVSGKKNGAAYVAVPFSLYIACKKFFIINSPCGVKMDSG